MGLKEIASKLKHLEKATGVDKQERLLDEVCEIIRQFHLVNPLSMQEHYWPLVELTHDEIRAMGRREKSIADFQDRFKMRFEDWCIPRSRGELNTGKYLSEIATFNDFTGDPYPEWWSQRKTESVTSEKPQ